MTETADDKISVFYDAACPSCVKDRRRFEKIAREAARSVLWVDIKDAREQLERLGISPQQALLELHVQTADGELLNELDAYIVLMNRVPWLRPLAWLMGLPLVRPMLACCYHALVARRLKRSGRWPY